MPPWNDVWDVLRQLMAPALGASLVLMLAVRLAGRERLTPLAAALALTAGVLVGNHFRVPTPITFPLEPDRPLTAHDLVQVLGWSLESKPRSAMQDESAPRAMSSHYWLPWAAGLALLVELLVRLPGVPPSAGWAARALVAVFVGRVLTPGFARLENPWLSWILSGAILLEWSVLLALARCWKDGTAASSSAGCFVAASVILLHAHTASLMDLSLLFFAALLGLALVAWWLQGDTGPALAAAAVVLPGVLLIGQQTNTSQVPPTSFYLAGLAPLALTPMLLPVLARQDRWKRWLPAILLPWLIAGVAVALAAIAEPLDFSKPAEPEW
jgi:hypothetical protein